MLLSHDIRSEHGPGDDFWYQPIGAVVNGVRITPDSALRVSTLYACVKVLAETIAQLPLIIYARQDDDGKERAVNHPLYNLLRRKPNRWQTGFEWREMMQGHVTIRGNAYSEILYAPNGRVLELVPLHPDRVKVEISQDGNSFRYIYTEKQGGQRIILRSEMFHLRGLSSDGIIGLSPIEIESQSIGLALAAQDYGKRFFENDATPPGWIENPVHFKDDDARRKFRQSWQESQTGPNRHKTAVLEKGMQYHQLGFKNRDIQFIETRKYQDNDIARIFRIPPHKVGILDKATFSNIEHQGIEFVTDTIMPWLVRWEQAISRDLIVQDNIFFAEFLVDALLRGDTKSRYEAYGLAITNGWMTRNEARVKENMNPKEGLDEPLQQLNMGNPQPGQDEESNPETDRDNAIRQNAAQRVVNKELIAIRKAYKKALVPFHGSDEFTKWVEKFYSEHYKYIQNSLALNIDIAKKYCTTSKNTLLETLKLEIDTKEPCIPDLLDDWEFTKPDFLESL